MIDIAYWGLLCCSIFFLLTSIYNVRVYRKIVSTKLRDGFEEKFISVIVPMRNEAENVDGIVLSLLNQNYKNFEIIVADDSSEDNTRLLLESYSEKIKIIDVPNLLDGWKGKNWANYNAYLNINPRSEILIFTDADVRFEQNTLKFANQYLLENSYDSFSIFPKQNFSGIGDFLIVPMFLSFLQICLVPWDFIYSRKNKKLSNAFSGYCGQFICITNESYKKFGTHESIKNVGIDDVAMARWMIAQDQNINWFVDNGTYVKCKMYDGFTSAFLGLSKVKLFKNAELQMITLNLGLMYLWLFPFYMLIKHKEYLIVVVILLLSRLIQSNYTRQDILYTLVFHPLQMISFFLFI